MKVTFPYGKDDVTLMVPDGALVYESRFPQPAADAAQTVLNAVRGPIAAAPLREALTARRLGPVVVVVSDVTRPIPYARFLAELLAEIEAAGVARDEVTLLVATGMHRGTTPAEREAMYGRPGQEFRVVDHDAADGAALVELPGRSWSGSRVRLNRLYVEAGFRLVTGLVEPHFMAGFSGGRKAVCPGLCSLETIRSFHGADFLGNPLARNASLPGNPCHEEAVSIARTAPPDFCLNVVLNRRRQVVRAFAGDLEEAHDAACRFVRKCACPTVSAEADVVVTSSGGHPLDGTFYQCVKGFVSCLPAVRRGGVVISFGACDEGVGSPEYAELMATYAGRWRDFLADIRKPGAFTKDQWELQMHARALERVGEDNLHFVSDGLTPEVLARLSVHGHGAEAGSVGRKVQELLDRSVALGNKVAVIPEGPYCAPLAPGT